MTSLSAQFGHFKINYNTQKEKVKNERIIVMCVEEEERIKIEKPDFYDAIKSKKIKNNGKDKNKTYLVFGVNKANMSGTKYTPKCHHYKKCGHMRKNYKKFKD
jgi:hypothetical protein